MCGEQPEVHQQSSPCPVCPAPDIGVQEVMFVEGLVLLTVRVGLLLFLSFVNLNMVGEPNCLVVDHYP